MTALWTNRANTTARWAAARTRAVERGTRIFQNSESGQFYASGSDGTTIYKVGWYDCDCRAAAEGDPICAHRAAFRMHCEEEDRQVAALLPVQQREQAATTMTVDDEGFPILTDAQVEAMLAQPTIRYSYERPADEPVCRTCDGEGVFRTYYGDHLNDYVVHTCHCQRVAA